MEQSQQSWGKRDPRAYEGGSCLQTSPNKSLRLAAHSRVHGGSCCQHSGQSGPSALPAVRGHISEKQQLAPAASRGDGGGKSFHQRGARGGHWVSGSVLTVPFTGQLSPDAAAAQWRVCQNKRFKHSTVWGKVNGRTSPAPAPCTDHTSRPPWHS
ncbi:calcium/calmodulin-dependent protein kinase type 1 [Platysternon megacephalum]|uniref:Calcium/calmodulin-dependent protein kinase type 1 n=1 Tax=Platysternon megacephalum TaxID=55544 RepID=A0A4D9DU91_9SAUR|nr:calcium/calmodulin-dependent protein kinase type 1 [Platysternon megacephalum]